MAVGAVSLRREVWLVNRSRTRGYMTYSVSVTVIADETTSFYFALEPVPY